MYKCKITVSKQTQRKLDLNRNMKCLMGIDTYLVLEKPNRCQLAKIRSLTVSQVQLTHKGKSENYLVNEEHKIILRKLDKQRSEECDLTYFTTDYPELMIVQDSLENSVKLLEMSTHADSLDLDLELRLSEEFLHFQMERVIQSSIHEVQKHLCTLGTNTLHQLERSPVPKIHAEEERRHQHQWQCCRRKWQ